MSDTQYGIPQVYPYPGDSMASWGENTSDCRVRIYSEAFRGSTANAACHQLKLDVCGIADYAPESQEDKQLRNDVPRNLEMLPHTLQKPASFANMDVEENFDAEYINIMLLSKSAANWLYNYCQASKDKALRLQQLSIRVYNKANFPEAPRELKVHFDAKAVLCSFCSHDENVVGLAAPDLQHIAYLPWMRAFKPI